MRISQTLVDELVEHALSEAPLECCGLIAYRAGEAVEICRCTNIAASATRFEIDGVEHWRESNRLAYEGTPVGAIYHSHTVAPATPSTSDIKLCAYPQLEQLIIGVQDPDWPEIRAWDLFGARAVELAVVVTG